MAQTIEPDEWREAYRDLFRWVVDGVRPAGEDLSDGLDDLDLGCDVTRRPT